MKTFTLFFISLCVAAAAGCSRPPQPKTDASAGASKSAAAPQVTGNEATDARPRSDAPTAGERLDQATDKAKQSADDAALTAKVKTALANDVGLKTLKIDIDSNAGVVRIRGMVENDETKKRVQEVAQAIPGVKWVQNQLSVAPKAS